MIVKRRKKAVIIRPDFVKSGNASCRPPYEPKVIVFRREAVMEILVLEARRRLGFKDDETLRHSVYTRKELDKIGDHDPLVYVEVDPVPNVIQFPRKRRVR